MTLVGRQPSTNHGRALRERVQKYCQTLPRDGIRYERIAYGGWQLVEEEGQFYLTAVGSETNPELSSIDLMILVFFVLSDVRTRIYCRNQYSPFLNIPLSRLIVRPPPEEEASSTPPDVDAWEQDLQQRFEDILLKHGV